MREAAAGLQRERQLDWFGAIIDILRGEDVNEVLVNERRIRGQQNTPTWDLGSQLSARS
jgi:hypothetical protein